MAKNKNFRLQIKIDEKKVQHHGKMVYYYTKTQ